MQLVIYRIENFLKTNECYGRSQACGPAIDIATTVVATVVVAGCRPVQVSLVSCSVNQGGYIFYAGASLAGVSCRRRWPRLLLLS